MEVGCALRWAPLLFARSAIVNGAGGVGVPAIDSPYFDMGDLDGLRREAQLVKALGYCGNVHPRELQVINTAFFPSEEEINQAHAIVAAGETTGTGVTAVGGQMVGPPFYVAASALVGRSAVAARMFRVIRRGAHPASRPPRRAR